MLSKAKVKWAREWLTANPTGNSRIAPMIRGFHNCSDCCGLLELAGWSGCSRDYNNYNKAKFYQYLSNRQEALVYATTTPDQSEANEFLKEAGFKPSVRGKSWKTNNIITLWTLALRSVRAKDF